MKEADMERRIGLEDQDLPLNGTDSAVVYTMTSDHLKFGATSAKIRRDSEKMPYPFWAPTTTHALFLPTRHLQYKFDELKNSQILNYGGKNNVKTIGGLPFTIFMINPVPRFTK